MDSPEDKVEMIRQFSNPQAWKSTLTIFILLLAWITGFASRLFSVIRFESIIHEFDPWFNYRATAHMTEHGLDNFLNWFDDRAWYPLGRIVGGTVYPGLMFTSGGIYHILHALNIPIHIREVCVFLAPVFSGLTAISTYLLTKELWNASAGLFAACFIAIVPGYISRSVAGSYDNEGIAIFALMFTYWLWIKAVKTGSIFWGALCAVSYMYMVSAWGGYVFITNLVPLHVFVLLLMNRYSSRIYVAYTTFFILGLIMSMQVPFVGFQPVRTSEHMAAMGVFLLLNAVAMLKYLQSLMTAQQFKTFFITASIVAAAIIFGGVVLLTYAGFIAPWSGRFYSLWDTGYAKIHIPIIASVSEHQPTTWTSFFFDLQILVCTFAAGAYFCIQKINDERVFIVLYAVFASYFAGVMVRLMLTLTPCVCVLSAIAYSHIMNIYIKDALPGPDQLEQKKTDERLFEKASRAPPKLPTATAAKQEDIGANLKGVVVILLKLTLLLFAVHCTWVTSSAYSSPSVVLASQNDDGSRYILDDFREAYHWISQNTEPYARVMSWWDYGYQIAGMANRTTLVDNNTWNNSHIAMVGKAMASNETEAYKIMQQLDVDYVLVIFGGLIGYSGDDINKFLWMVRIAEGEHPNAIKETDYFSEKGEYRIDHEASQIMLNSIMYKMSYWQFGKLQADHRSPPGYDRTRNAEIGLKSYSMEHLEEAYTSEHWLVRVFKVKKPKNMKKMKKLRRKVTKRSSRKTRSNKVGNLANKPKVVKGAKKSA